MLPSRRALLLASPALLLGRFAQAQGTWPERPIRWIVNFPPGGAADTLSRALGESIGNKLGQPIVIENRPGAGGLVGADLVAKARGDAHIVLMSSAASHGIGPVLYPSMPYDPMADFIHIGLVGTFASVLVVGSGVPAANLREFLTLAKSRPGGLAYGTGGNGTMNHLIGQVLARAAGVELTHVPYRGSAAALTDAMGGQIPAVMESLPIALPHLRAGRLKALATSEAARDAALPEVPSFAAAGLPAGQSTNWFGVSTAAGVPGPVIERWQAVIAAALPEVPSFAEAGLPAVQSTNWFGFSTAAGVPAPVIERWQAVIAAALQDPKLQERFANIGVVPGRMDPAAYTAMIQGELTRWREVIQSAGIKAD
ncbi:tripartite tricarboxylate transporter substrate binding protein [Siccirubricoccus sp. KC 17139]|uniref:Tripartite tricarboxylate transporter substrate binding protein n=1 Tax=Siccirubricoccus soli TaxID=2899147 RepID=A0ABT1D4V0_9PROT|nr:tripartite tricarboxylate transporter substrate-binding protein [Siccirubricoccus soli]MCO6416962.1 tripartite tricarboxylate transporter substrate binding protein [Siccirubricoccus soli]MCP2683097.1 tripartite tricarboxylate transporter substrate-binding protein [Siccirubricoccus soli]